MLVDGEAQVARRGNKVAIAEEIHTVDVALDEHAWRIGQVKPELRAGDRNRRQQRGGGRNRGMMNSIAGDLGGGLNRSRRIKHIELDSKSKMAALSPENVVLVAHAIHRRVQIALCRQTSLEGLTLKHDRATENRL